MSDEVLQVTLDGDRFELTPTLVRARIVGHAPEDLHQYWVEIDGVRWPVKQVISLATGVADRQRFQSQSARRWLQQLGFAIGGGQSVDIPSRRSARREPTTPPVGPTSPVPAADVVLVGCVKSKLGCGAPAKDLYVSDYFTKMRDYAEASGRPWFILSAEHGLVSPDEWLEPYERYLPNTSRDYRRAWGERVASQLERAVGPLAGLVLDVHAGGTYVESLRAPMRRHGADVLDQLSGLSFGRRLSWYLHNHRSSTPSSQTVIAHLRDRDAGMNLSDFTATRGEGLRVPGLYSWWVDEVGAADLTAGMGHVVAPGLIYAGLAGATRSGGSTSSNTLWGRVATMHLGKKNEFSTLRRSLGSVLASAHGQTAIDEEELTGWMHAHLRVVTVPYLDADALGALETDVLAELDPPLNLSKVPRTALREQLSALRRRYTGPGAGA